MIQFRSLLLYLSICGAVIGVPFAVYGAPVQDTFTINTQVGTDTIPPTTPTGLTAIPVATTQIDLSWSSSTDNFLLAGYQVFRDAVQIATTTMTSYSDVGLTPSTTYTYYVTAFDSFGNVSSSSTAVATTTLATTTPPPPPPPSGGGGGGGGGGERIELVPIPIEITSLEVVPGQTSVLLRFETPGYVRSVIRWGRTTSYELGSLAERAFSQFHERRITGLDPGTRYHFTIEGENNVGTAGVLTTDTFTTLPLNDTLPPANVLYLDAVLVEGGVKLSWQNPLDEDFEYVRIVRNNRFYPIDAADGWYVYEGDGTETLDRSAVLPGTHQFYTVFTYDTQGNRSSGAVASVFIPPSDGAATDPPRATTTPSIKPDPTINPAALTFDAVQFYQEGRRIPKRTDGVHIDGTKELVIAVPYEAVPEHLKSIVVSITHSEDQAKVFTFLLRIDEEKHTYTATIAPLGFAGVFPVTVAVYDFKTTQVGYADGTLNSRIAHTEATSEKPVGFLGYLFIQLLSLFGGYLFWFLLILAVLFGIGVRLVRHKRAT